MGNTKDLKLFENFIIDSINSASFDANSDLYLERLYKKITKPSVNSFFRVLFKVKNLTLVTVVILVIGVLSPVVKRNYENNQKFLTVENILKDIDNTISSLDEITAELNENLFELIESY